MAVFHSEFLIYALAFRRPQPSSCHFKFSLISLLNSTGRDTKYHPPGAECCQIFAENSYLILVITESYCCLNYVNGTFFLFSILVSLLSIEDQFTLKAKMSFIEKSCITICNNGSE